ncbi:MULTISPECIES: ArsR/SmtB family transcription factor [Streptomyces]|uniref:ArsR/SmtB family transcription factor n=1 Tax=Streptomyces TaxID=1883 RepID=UPI001E59A669|nr:MULTISPECIES: helix-turn-helix domain-containing protein [Streptomyces]UFQ15915.1 helix-turn-helix domain-containing protein [Streptomyces huasconensis]WCL85518.1 helix-turn-helix domain-containing protein [Streptomyces sp. JCM 35825]
MTEQSPPRNIHRLDARTLRGLAHPLRMRLLSSLRLDGPATASQLAARLGESSGATSYHLRRLAEYGFVEDDPERGKGRERWWRSAHQGTRTDEHLIRDPDPEVRGALNTLLHEYATQRAQEVSTWIATRHEWSREWDEAADTSDFTLDLTPALAAELGDKVHELVESYRALAPEADTPDVAKVRVHSHIFPTRPKADGT